MTEPKSLLEIALKSLPQPILISKPLSSKLWKENISENYQLIGIRDSENVILNRFRKVASVVKKRRIDSAAENLIDQARRLKLVKKYRKMNEDLDINCLSKDWFSGCQEMLSQLCNFIPDENDGSDKLEKVLSYLGVNSQLQSLFLQP